MADDYGTEKIVAISLDLVARVAGLVRVQELPCQVIDQLPDLPLLPGVLTLVEVDGVPGLVEQFADGACAAVNGLGLGICGRHTGASSETGTRSRPGHCQVNRDSLFFKTKLILSNTANQRLSWHVNQWNLQDIS